MKPSRWFKRILWVLALSMVGSAILFFWSLQRLHATPDWYRPQQVNPEQKQAAANRAFDKILEARDWAMHQQVRAAASRFSATAKSAEEGTVTLNFTQEELNAFLDKWSVMLKQRGRDVNDYVQDPMIVLQPDRLIFAGQVREVGDFIASLHMVPMLDQQGNLLMKLKSLQSGNFPLPRLMWARPINKLKRVLQDRLPPLRQEAQLFPDGTVNEAAVRAAAELILLDVLNEKPSEPVLFLPLLDKPVAVPVRVVAINVTDQNISITAQPLTGEQLQKLIQWIRKPAATTGLTAAAN